MLSTAECRRNAQTAESHLEWEKAVMYWRLALQVYPNTSGELAEADRDRIITAINADMSMCEVP